MMTVKRQPRKSRLQLLKSEGVQNLPQEGRRIVPLDLLVEDPRNERKTYRNMEGLIATVKAVGVIEPLTVIPHRDGKYMITTGHRRFRAATATGLNQVTVIVSDGESETVRRRKSIISNVQREDVGPVEMAEGLQALLDEDSRIKTQRELATLIGKREAWVSDILRILTLPPNLQKKLRTSEVSVPYDAVMRIARVESSEEQKTLIDAVLNGATNREIRERIEQIKTGNKQTNNKPKKPKEVFSTDHGFTLILQSDSTEEISSEERIAGLKQVLKRLSAE